MSTQVKHRRGTAAENASFTGALGEFTYMTDTKRIAAHDAATAGGKTFLNVTDIQNKVGTGDATVGGTGNAITLTHTFPRTAHTTGAEIQFKATADNSGAVTVAIDSIAGTKALEKMVNGTSTALSTGDLKNGVIYLGRYDGTRYQLQANAGVSVSDRQVFTASGTWSKPSNFDPTAMVLLEVWGAGAGGGYNGSIAGNGGNSSIGSLITAYGGTAGNGNGRGGNGGGANGSTIDILEGIGKGNTSAQITLITPSTGTLTFNNIDGYFTGGGGGSDVVGGGGKSVHGGGGGGCLAAAGGTSQFGGAGGAANVAGTAPGGGGGGHTSGPTSAGGGGSYKFRWIPLSSMGATETITIGAGGAAAGGAGAAGARGEARITVFG